MALPTHNGGPMPFRLRRPIPIGPAGMPAEPGKTRDGVRVAPANGKQALPSKMKLGRPRRNNGGSGNGAWECNIPKAFSFKAFPLIDPRRCSELGAGERPARWSDSLG